MKILAIESSCDETAVAVVEDGRKVLTDCIASQVELHRIYGGVVPEIASRKHIEAIYGLADEALEKANIQRSDIDAVAVTYLLHPEWIQTKRANVKVDIDGRETYGQTVCDFRPDRNKALDNATVCLDIDREKFIELLVTACKNSR